MGSTTMRKGSDELLLLRRRPENKLRVFIECEVLTRVHTREAIATLPRVNVPAALRVSAPLETLPSLPAAPAPARLSQAAPSRTSRKWGQTVHTRRWGTDECGVSGFGP